MNAVAPTATESPRSFSVRMVREDLFVIEVDGRTVTLERETPVVDSRMLISSDKPVYGWTARVQSLADNHTSVLITTLGGMFIAAHHDHVAIARDRLNECITRARRYLEALNRLSVEVDARLAALPKNASKKTRKQLTDASERLLRGELAHDGKFNGGYYGAMVGETYIVLNYIDATKTEPARWTMRTYEVGDEAVYHGFYIGTIESISPKRITVRDGSTVKSLTHERFAFWNRKSIDKVRHMNAQWMD